MSKQQNGPLPRTSLCGLTPSPSVGEWGGGDESWYGLLWSYDSATVQSTEELQAWLL